MARRPDTTGSRVGKKIAEKKAEAVATAALLDDPVAFDAFIKQQVAEELARALGSLGAERRVAGAMAAREKADLSRHPWGLDYLRSRDARTPDQSDEVMRRVHADLSAIAAASKEGSARADLRNKELERRLPAARRLTLTFADKIAHMMDAVGLPADTEVYEESLRTRKTYKGLGHLIMKGNLHSDEEYSEFSPSPVTRGWLLNLGSAKGSYATAVLCEDGRILTGYGGLRSQGNNHRFDYQPVNQQGESSAGFLNEHYESDVTASPLSSNDMLVNAGLVLKNEQALQDALIGLMVDRGLHPIPAEV